jgi:hypothetical protein
MFVYLNLTAFFLQEKNKIRCWQIGDKVWVKLGVVSFGFILYTLL